MVRLPKAIKNYLSLIVVSGLAWSAIVITFQGFVAIERGVISLSFWLIAMAIALIFFVVSRFISKNFLQNFPFGSTNLKEFIRYLMSVSLCFYLMLFVSGRLEAIWQVLILSPSLYNDVTLVFLVTPLYIVLLLIFVMGPVLILGNLAAKSSSVVVKIIAVFTYIGIWMFYLYYVLTTGASIDWDGLLTDRLLFLTKIIIGSLPLGWFNELFLSGYRNKNGAH